MDSWNVRADEGGDYVLLNKTRVPVTLSNHAVVDLGSFLSKMEERGVPIAFADQLKEIYFTILPGEKPGAQTFGDYKDGIIRISTDLGARDEAHLTLIHELGHHMDARYDISSRQKIIDEKRECARFMPDSYARSNVSEYVACGFEVFYFGTRKERGDFRRNNPRLYNTIKYLHQKYRSKI